MKERLLTILAAVALLVAVLQPAAPVSVPNADCHGGGQCSI